MGAGNVVKGDIAKLTPGTGIAHSERLLTEALLTDQPQADLSHRFRPPLPVFGPDMAPPPQGRSGAARFHPPPLEIGPENAGSLAPPPTAAPAPLGSPFEHIQSLAPREIGPENVGSLARPPAPVPSVVTLSGNASVDHALHIDVTLDPDLRADLDYVRSLSWSMPLNSADVGTMDSDTAPQRGPAGGGQ